MYLRSIDFKDGGSIPTLHTCDGANVSPHLEWGEAPEGTKSFAIVCVDPEAKTGTFIHWLVVKIPASVTEIAQGGRTGGQELTNSYRQKGYGGPCPPTGTHKYVFTLYALDAEKQGDFSDAGMETIAFLEYSAVAKVALVGKYRRK